MTAKILPFNRSSVLEDVPLSTDANTVSKKEGFVRLTPNMETWMCKCGCIEFNITRKVIICAGCESIFKVTEQSQ